MHYQAPCSQRNLCAWPPVRLAVEQQLHRWAKWMLNMSQSSQDQLFGLMIAVPRYGVDLSAAHCSRGLVAPS